MRKLILALAALLAGPAFAQTYPSPTFNHIVTQSDTSTGPISTMSVTVASQTQTLATWLPLFAQKANNLSDLASVSSARTNLGLGTAALINTPVSAANGGTGAASLTAAFDTTFSSTQGAVLYRNASAWVALAPGSNGNVLTSGGAAANLSWTSAGSGTVTSVTCSNGLNGGAFTTSGACSVEQGPPGGRLTLVSGGCNVTTDQVAQTSLYYAPCTGEFVPIYNGTLMQSYQFTASPTDTVGLSIALGSNWAASTLYDAFVGLNAGAVTLCTGPAWTASTSGTSARGTGAGTTQLALLKGIWTNAVSMTCRYGNASTFTCGINQCTYLGTVLTSTTAGQIDLKFGTAASGGGAAKLSICNQYNRNDIRAWVSDTTASWTYNSATWRPANAGTTQVAFVSCQGDVQFVSQYVDLINETATASQNSISVGLNNSALPATRANSGTAPGSLTLQPSLQSSLIDISVAGLNTVYAIEQSSTQTVTFYGQLTPYNYMQLTLQARL